MVTALTLNPPRDGILLQCCDCVENEEIRLARQYYLEKKDAASAVAKMPKWHSVEKSLLQGLAKHAEKANFLGALNFVSIRMIFHVQLTI